MSRLITSLYCTQGLHGRNTDYGQSPLINKASFTLYISVMKQNSRASLVPILIVGACRRTLRSVQLDFLGMYPKSLVGVVLGFQIAG